MQQDKTEVIFDPNQVFPVPFTLISNLKKSLTSSPLKQPFGYEVYCPISCKKIKIGVVGDKGTAQTIQFNTTSSRWVSANIQNDIKYLVNGHNPTKKDKKKAAGEMLSVFIDVQDRGNVAIFNPFYIDPEKPLSFYVSFLKIQKTFTPISKAEKPGRDFQFGTRMIEKGQSKSIMLNNRKLYLFQQRGCSFICTNENFEDISDNYVTIIHPEKKELIYRDSARDIKQLVNDQLNYWLNQFHQHYILQQTGKSKSLEHNIDHIYKKLSFYLNIDEQLRIKLSTNKNRELLKQLYPYHPRMYNAMNRLCSFINYGNTKHDVKKLADLGFFNKTDMLQDLAYVESPHVGVPTAEEGLKENEQELRQRTFPYARMNRSLPFPNVDLQTCLIALPAQTVSKTKIILTQATNPYIIFVDKNKKLTAWSGKLAPFKLFELDLAKQHITKWNQHKILTKQNIEKQTISLNQQKQESDLLAIGDMFNETADTKQLEQTQIKPAQELAPDQLMVQQLLSMGYKLSIVKQALINVKNESIPVALDEIEKLMTQQKKVEKKKPKPKTEWSCPTCTLINPPTNSVCEACQTEPEFVDQEEIARKKKEQEDKKKEQQEFKKQLQRKKLQKEKKLFQQEEKKKKEQEEKKAKEEFLRRADIKYCKLFRSKESSVNPFVVVTLLVDKELGKSLMKIIRIGYNRMTMTQFYRYENGKFISNFTRNIHDENQQSIQPINEIITESWEQIEQINRLIHGYREDEFVVLEEKKLQWNVIVENVTCDGSIIVVGLKDEQQQTYKIQSQDTLEKSTFSLIKTQSELDTTYLKQQQKELNHEDQTSLTLQRQSNSKRVITEEQLKKLMNDNLLSIQLSANTTTALIEVTQHFPAGSYQQLAWARNVSAANKKQISQIKAPTDNNTNNNDTKPQSQIVMSEFLPIMIESYEGSIFSSKYHPTSLFQRNNLYISNYPQANFTFKNIHNKPLLVETVTVISQNKRLQKIYPIETGLVFTANEVCWFQIAKKMFANFTKQDYDQWLENKKGCNKKQQGHREFWEPVAFVELDSQTQVEIQYKRPAKYVFFLPTSVRTYSDKVDVAALKIDFFGVKGRVEEMEEDSSKIENFKDDVKSDENKLIVSAVSSEDMQQTEGNQINNIVVKRRSCINTINFLPKSYNGFDDIDLSITTVYEIRLKQQWLQHEIKINSAFLYQLKIEQQNNLQRQDEGESKVIEIKTYKKLIENYNTLSEGQVTQRLQHLQMREFVELILNNTKSFRIFEKLLKAIYDSQQMKQRLFESMSRILPQMCNNQQVLVSESGLKSFLRIYQKLVSTLPLENIRILEKSLTKAWQSITNYVGKVRNKNYTVIRNKYYIQQLILQPQLFSKDYYRLIHPSYIQEQLFDTVIQQPKTQMNNMYFVQKQNSWFYKTHIVLPTQQLITKVNLHFPKLQQSVNRYKLCIKIFVINDNYEQQVFYRYWNEEMLYQFTNIAYKDKEIYAGERVNCLGIDINMIGRVIRLEYSYLLVTTINALRYKEPTESLIIYPIIKGNPIGQHCVDKQESSQQTTTTRRTYNKTIASVQKNFPKQAKHSSIEQNLPPIKYTTDSQFTFYQIYQFPIINHEDVSKEFTTLIDKIVTNIMDQKIVEECIKGMKISQYKYNQKGLDFAYTFMIKILKLFKKLPQSSRVDTDLLLEMFDIFVVYEIGPIMKKVMAFINENYKRLMYEEKIEFVAAIIEKYLSSFSEYKELKESEKYSLVKIIQKLHELELPIGLLIGQLEKAYHGNNRFLVSMLLKLIRPNLIKFGLKEHNFCHNPTDHKCITTLKQMLSTVFKFNLWVLDSVENIKIELLTSGMELFETLNTTSQQYTQKHSSKEEEQFVNEIEEQEIWKLVFLTLKLKNQELNKQINTIFRRLVSNSTETFKKSLNRMLLEIIKKNQSSLYSKINGEVNNDLWMNHLQTILEYLDINDEKSGGNIVEDLLSTNKDGIKEKKKNFVLDVDTAIELLQLPLTPTLWSHALLIIPKEDKVLNAIIKNFKKEYYSSLGKEITQFCQPLAGIRSLDSIHVNWLDLVKKIRLENRSIFSLFIEELRKSTFGGKEGVTMAATEDVKQLEITSEFLKLVLEKDLPVRELDEQTISEIFVWYFINSTQSTAESPASELLKRISQNVLTLIKKISEIPELVQISIRSILNIKRDSQKLQTMYQEKRLPTHSALTLTKRFCKCFEELIQIFMSSDQISGFFAFEINGLEYLMEKLGLMKTKEIKSSSKPQQNAVASYLPEEEFLLDEKILSKKVQNSHVPVEIKSLQELKEQEFANNVKIVPTANSTASTNNTDWTLYKKGNKTKIIFLSMTDPSTYFEYPLYVELGKTVQVRSIKIGFPCASFEYTDKIVVSPSAVLIEGSTDGKNYKPLGEMTYIDDDGYLSNGVKVFVLNLQKVKKISKIDESIKGIQLHRVKYLKIVVKRPLVSFVEGQYSTLNGRLYNNVGVSISFMSVMGDDTSKIPTQLIDQCKQMSKKSALNILKSLLTESNLETMKRISNQETFFSKVKENFHQLKQLMYKYKEIVPQIIYTLGSNNTQLGDWLIENFIKSAKQEIEAKIINQIIVSTPQKIYQRLNYFQSQLFKQFAIIKSQSEVESSLLYAKYVPFMQSFCKTLEECYEIDFHFNKDEELVLDCDQVRIDYLIDIYDKKHSSPDIKSLLKLLIALVWIRKPLKLAEEVVFTTLDLVWRNCSEAKPYFYNIMSALLVSKVSVFWIRNNDHQKVKSLINEIEDSLQKDNLKALKCQMFLLSILSYHESQYLTEIGYHIKIYNALKLKTFTDSEIYDYLMKILQNVVLGTKEEEEKFAALLIQDVSLLVKRKDPILQKLYVGLLGVEQEVMIHLKGVDIASRNSSNNKKTQGIPSKILSKQQQKSLAEKLGKKFKYHLTHQSQDNIDKQSATQKIIKSLYNSSALLILKVQRSTKIFHMGIYCPVTPTKHIEDEDYWQQQLLADKNTFIFTYSESDHKFITCKPNEKVITIYSPNQDNDYDIIIQNDNKELVRISIEVDSYMNVHSSMLLENGDEMIEDDVKLISFELFQCKPIVTGKTTDSKLTDLLSKSNQAKAPFTWYRHNQLYIFPADITVSKLQKLLSSKVSIENLEQKNDNLKLKEIENQDFIIDVNIENLDDYEGQEDYGYIPKMNIFDSFSRLGGINEVLRLGSQSIKDWKNAQRKKNFEHYMDELKSFIHLPNFFSLFIKNHTYVTFLFEVASGMPDDSNSTRNWQEQEVNSSRFIYKILSDIFKFDRSKQLRDMNKYEDFCEIILQKLSEIAKQASRVYKEEQVKEEQALEVADKLEKKKTEQQKRRKKKGTGYGADNQNNSKWSSAEWLENKKIRSQQTLRVVSIFVSFLDCEVPIQDQRLSQVIKSSCLLPLIESALRSSSLLEIAKQIDLFKCYLSIVRNMAKNPSTIGCLMQIEKNYKPQQTESIHSLLGKLNNISEIFLECLKSGKQASDESNQNTESLAIDIQKTFQQIDKAVRSLSKNKSSLTIKQINDLPIQTAYRMLLEKLRFGYVDMKKGTVYDHCLHSSVSSSSPSTQKILRLSQQLADLSSSLPCEHTNSIFVRCDKSRIDLVKILIMGSKDTPYSNGAFMFDLYCDDSYPNNPPKMVIATTGQGKVRFNPNLYSCGKVCLSLLGTWRGSASENWDPKLSTLLQLFISTQGITMSEDVYFNEPGFDGEQGTEEGEKKNEAYSNIVRLGNVRYAMIDQIKNPPKGFEDVIQRHFYAKKKEIIEQCEKWLQWAQKRQASYTGLVSDHNSSWCSQLKASKTKYKELLQIQIEQLKQALNSIPEPDLKEKAEQQGTFSKVEKKKRKAKQAELEIDVAYDKEKKEELKIEQNVMQDRWSRYIGAMGLEAVKKQSSSNVLLVGLKPLGLQIAKNLILSGLQKLTIVENETLDSGSEQHFYMSDLKGKKIQQCIFKLKQLNPYMLVDHLESLPEQFKGYHLVVSTLSIEQSQVIAQKCRKECVKFVYSQTCGVSGSYFADFGEKFVINDPNGEESFEGLIEKITCEKQGVVKLLEGVKHPYQDGDYVVLTKVEGMEIESEQSMQQHSDAQQFYNKTISSEPNTKLDSINGHVFQIKVINWNSFSIGDTTKFKPYIRNGIAKNIKVPKTVKFEPFEHCVKEFDKFVDPNMGIYDFEKMGDNFAVFACFLALSKFEKKHNAKPENWSQQQSKQFVQIVKEISEEYKKSQDQTKGILEFANKFAPISQAQLPTIGAYLGGIVSQQIIKGLTNKYTPINQFFTFHLNEMMQKIPEDQNKWNELKVKKEEEFRNIKIVIGQESMNKIQHMKLFVVGAGAIGCELLKNFAMVNMCSKGKITVTDPDHIETSNLTRQFLFRQKHVKKPKSATAAAVLMQMNPHLKNHISARLDKVCEQSEDIYSDDFFKVQTVVANALDNVKARQYMDKRCVANKIPLFESGTLGPKGHVQVIVPYKTQNYGSQADPEEQAQIPHCTLKMFPEDLTHCIEWSRDIFGKIFTLNPKALKKIIDSKDLSSLQGKQKTTVAKMIKHRPKKFEDCIDEAVRVFFKYFKNDIRQLMYTYPLDMKTKEGKLFWTLPKRPPKEISEIDPKNQNHQTFIASYSVLFAKIFSIEYPKDFRKSEGKSKIMEHAVNVKVEDFIPSAQKSKEIQQMNEKEEKTKQKMSEGNQKAQTQPVEQQANIDLTPEVLKLEIKPEEFEKDEDENGHIDLIYSMSNLRAQNYDLGECKWIDAKLKAGRIMAALSTTTSVVAAIQTLEIIKIVLGCELWRNAFVNLAVPLVQISEPGPAVKEKIGNTQFSVWQDWQFKASSLRDLLTQIKDKYEVEGFNISTSEGTPIFWEAMYKDKQEAQQTLLTKKLSQLIGKEKTLLNILFRDLKGEKIYEKVPKVTVQATE